MGKLPAKADIMKCKITKTQNGFSIEIPNGAQLAEGEAELFESANGTCIIVAQKKNMDGKKTMLPAQAAMSDDENALIKKLSAIKFENRTPADVDKKLSQKEMAVLATLVKKKIVNVFYGEKYAKTGVYSISNNAFVKATQAGAGANEKAENGGAAMVQAQNIPLIAELEKNGFAVVENELQARLVASILQPKIASGDVLGVRGFDRRYYLATKKFYVENEQKAQNSLSKPKSSVEFAAEAKLSIDAATAILHLMCEKGEAIEKRRGLFERA